MMIKYLNETRNYDEILFIHFIVNKHKTSLTELHYFPASHHLNNYISQKINNFLLSVISQSSGYSHQLPISEKHQPVTVQSNRKMFLIY